MYRHWSSNIRKSVENYIPVEITESGQVSVHANLSAISAYTLPTVEHIELLEKVVQVHIIEAATGVLLQPLPGTCSGQ